MTVDELIERRAAEFLAELQVMAETAFVAIDRKLCLPPKFIKRAAGQRRRFRAFRLQTYQRQGETP